MVEGGWRVESEQLLNPIYTLARIVHTCELQQANNFHCDNSDSSSIASVTRISQIFRTCELETNTFPFSISSQQS